MFKFIKNIATLCLILLIASTSTHKDVFYISEIVGFYDTFTDFNLTKLNNKHYFKPVSNEWRTQKCESLGFKFNKSSSFLKKNKTTDSLYLLTELDEQFLVYDDRENCLYMTLLLAICGDKMNYYDLRKKVLNNMRNSKELLNLIGEENLDKYLTLKKEKVLNDYASVVELIATAEYLDVCIYLYVPAFKEWILYYKDWPNYEKFNMENEHCLYLVKMDVHIFVIVDTKPDVSK
ncbi:uncharacterized protein LOC126896616 [Daktulosphaira vitifoliae]|uniref:uncharacterized protein LOC126896616 n=1 Tax=Daktulosphaira vitifoliae TaxID=58002 RepID=UPI0021A98ED0|nr:uncharacterized protein LOC126896616 [Daktulosphaira vitifoliae]